METKLLISSALITFLALLHFYITVNAVRIYALPFILWTGATLFVFISLALDSARLFLVSWDTMPVSPLYFLLSAALLSFSSIVILASHSALLKMSNLMRAHLWHEAVDIP